MKWLTLVSFLLAASAAAQPAAIAPEVVAQRVFDIAAGPAWDQARYIEFSFNVEREGKIAASFVHRWDRFTGDYRVSGKDREGRDFVVRLNLNTRAGKAWVNGELVADPKEWIDRGYARFINDTYWLLMPLKLRDPGVTLTSAGMRESECGRILDGVKLTFGEGIGLTPGDQYWVWADRETGLVEVWEMLLQGMKPDDPRRVYRFEDYQRHGNLLLSARKSAADGSAAIVLGDIVIRADVPKGAFE